MLDLIDGESMVMSCVYHSYHLSAYYDDIIEAAFFIDTKDVSER
jgi:hypothetical protein